MLGISIADQRFEFGKQIASGSFGVVYYGIDTRTTKEVGIKLERSNCESPSLQFEAEVYTILGPCRGLPTLVWYGQESGCNVLVLELLGPSLRDLMHSSGSRFTNKTMMQICWQALDVLQYVHSHGFVHCDIKPANFLIGRGEYISTLYLVDFGLAKLFWTDTAKTHIPYRVDKTPGIIGTPNYVSINAHRGIELSRRDDLESLAYTLIHMVTGRLPWESLGTTFDNELRNRSIGTCKILTKWEDLCQGSSAFFSTLVMTACCLEFHEAPNYDMMRRWIKTAAEDEGIAFDGNIDWT